MTGFVEDDGKLAGLTEKKRQKKEADKSERISQELPCRKFDGPSGKVETLWENKQSGLKGAVIQQQECKVFPKEKASDFYFIFNSLKNI